MGGSSSGSNSSSKGSSGSNSGSKGSGGGSGSSRGPDEAERAWNKSGHKDEVRGGASKEEFIRNFWRDDGKTWDDD